MNDQDYIKQLAIKHGLCQLSGDQYIAIDVRLISFAKELEARVLEEADKKILNLPVLSTIVDVSNMIDEMIAERRGE
jgi:hypothetical protein